MLIVASGNIAERTFIAVSVSSQLLLTPREGRQGLEVSTDADPVYLKLWSAANGTDASAANPASTGSWDIHIAAGGVWPGTIGGVVWAGGLSVIGTGTPSGSVVAVAV